MKAISLWQPWASLVAHEFKHFETRSWATHYRGPLAIHAAKRKPELFAETDKYLIKAIVDMGYHKLIDLPYGCIVCTCELTACYQTEIAVSTLYFDKHKDTESHFGDFTPGRFAWRLENVKLVSNVPARGSQGFWEWQPEGGPVAAAREVRRER